MFKCKKKIKGKQFYWCRLNRDFAYERKMEKRAINHWYNRINKKTGGFI